MTFPTFLVSVATFTVALIILLGLMEEISYFKAKMYDFSEEWKAEFDRLSEEIKDLKRSNGKSKK